MSERGEVEVLLPLERIPTQSEQERLMHVAFGEARRLVEPLKGKVLGLVSVARAQSQVGELAMKVRFACQAPESVWARKTMISVDNSYKDKASQ